MPPGFKYAAQAAALHSGLQAADEGEVRSGMLAALRDIKLSGLDIAQVEGPLDIHAKQEMAAAAGMIYAFEVRAADTPLASGRLTIVIRDPNPNG